MLNTNVIDILPVIAFFFGVVMISGIMYYLSSGSKALRLKFPRRFVLNPIGRTVIAWPIQDLADPSYTSMSIFRELLDPRYRFLTHTEVSELRRLHPKAEQYRVLVADDGYVVLGETYCLPDGTSVLVTKIA